MGSTPENACANSALTQSLTRSETEQAKNTNPQHQALKPAVIGGAMDYNKVSVEFEEDGTATPILYVDFDFSKLHNIEDEARDILAEGKSLAPFIKACSKAQTELIKWAAITTILRTLVDYDKPGMTARLLAYSFGLLADQGLTLAAIGREYGVKKQAAQQRLDRAIESIGIKNPTYGARSRAARASMVKANRSNICKQ